MSRAAPTTRAAQREATRQRIVDAAVAAFTELGFGAASTRDIAARAGVTQGLVTYHFDTKDSLWRAAADQIFGQLPPLPGPVAGHDPSPGERRERAREALRDYVRFSARHPELVRFMVDDGGDAAERMAWLTSTHLQPRFDAVGHLVEEVAPGADRAAVAHFFYAIVGASSLIFAVAPECEALSGLDPTTGPAIEQHAELVVGLFLGGDIR